MRRRPPDALVQVDSHRRDEDRSHDEGVEQDAKGDRDADLRQRDERQHRENREGAGEDDAADVVTPPVTASLLSMAARVGSSRASSRTRAPGDQPGKPQA